jgi:hypothetical protein
VRWIYTITVTPLFLFLSCSEDKPRQPGTLADTTQSQPAQDTSYSEMVAHRIKPMEVNVERIEAIQNWTSVSTVNTEDESTEGGYTRYYYLDRVLEKVVNVQFGESGRQLTEYYLLNGKLSFVLEKNYTYNRPVYWDSVTARQNNDKEVFDIDKSEIEEAKSYFQDGEIMVQVYSDCGAPNDREFEQKEGKRIQTDFGRLMGKLIKEPVGHK